MTHYCCLGCIREAGYWYQVHARRELQICCVCCKQTQEWLPCPATAGKTDEELPCAAVHLADVS